MASAYYGINLSWGLGVTTVTVTGVTGLFQSTDHEQKLDEFEGKDQRGNVVSWTGYNPTEAATFTYLASDANTASGSAAVTAPATGAKVTVGCDSALSGSGWIIQSVTVGRTNTEAAKVTLKGIRYAAIS